MNVQKLPQKTKKNVIKVRAEGPQLGNLLFISKGRSAESFQVHTCMICESTWFWKLSVVCREQVDL